MVQAGAEPPARVGPGRAARRSRACGGTGARGEHGDEGGDLLRSRIAAHDLEETSGFAHKGMFPCFFGGSAFRLSRSARRARTIWLRVSDGLITASTYPREAAM